MVVTVLLLPFRRPKRDGLLAVVVFADLVKAMMDMLGLGWSGLDWIGSVSELSQVSYGWF